MRTAIDTQKTLNDLLPVSSDAEKNRITAHFANKFKQNKDVILYGAGTLGKHTLSGLRRIGIEPLAFVEDRIDGHSRSVENLPVLSLARAAELYGNQPLYVVTILNNSFSFPKAVKQLIQHGCTRVQSFMSLFHAYPDTFLPYYHLDHPDRLFSARDSILEASTLFSDEQSKAEFIRHLKFRLHLDFSVLPNRCNQTYFPADLFPDPAPECRLVDLGAFTGDTVELFLQRTKNQFAKIWAIEPDYTNFIKLETFVRTLEPALRNKIDCLNVAVADQSGRLSFRLNGAEDSRHCPQSESKVTAVTLDSLFANEKVTFIKFDIEGMEQQALAGGKQIIAEQKPALAVSVYHCPDDIWQIPIYLKSLRQDYKLFLRTEGEDSMGVIVYAL